MEDLGVLTTLGLLAFRVIREICAKLTRNVWQHSPLNTLSHQPVSSSSCCHWPKTRDQNVKFQKLYGG